MRTRLSAWIAADGEPGGRAHARHEVRSGLPDGLPGRRELEGEEPEQEDEERSEALHAPISAGIRSFLAIPQTGTGASNRNENGSRLGSFP